MKKLMLILSVLVLSGCGMPKVGELYIDVDMNNNRYSQREVETFCILEVSGESAKYVYSYDGFESLKTTGNLSLFPRWYKKIGYCPATVEKFSKKDEANSDPQIIFYNCIFTQNDDTPIVEVKQKDENEWDVEGIGGAITLDDDIDSGERQ